MVRHQKMKHSGPNLKITTRKQVEEEKSVTYVDEDGWNSDPDIELFEEGRTIQKRTTPSPVSAPSKKKSMLKKEESEYGTVSDRA